MTVKFTVNNYQLGAKVKSTPTHKIINQERVDKSHTAIYYAEINERELQLIEKVLARKGVIIKEI